MNRIFWGVVALDTLLFLVLLIATLRDTRASDGGKEMGLFFFILVPCCIIGLAVLLFVYARSAGWRILALLIVAGPGLFLTGSRLRDAWIGHIIREKNSGRGYFSGRALREMGAAVVQRDTVAITRLAPTLDINTVGERGKTFLGLAVEQAFDAPDSADPRPSSLVVAQTLLSLGAKPEPGLEEATKRKDPSILRALLEAKADPNFRLDDRGPVVFEWLGVMPVENLRLLIDHGLDINCVGSNGTPLVVAIGEAQRWDLVELLLQRGADPARADRDGRTIGQFVDELVTDRTRNGDEVGEDLLRIQTLLRH
ncbi:MAG: ankyrin repeat domain-containing protein [Gemmatimonadota bacterium]